MRTFSNADVDADFGLGGEQGIEQAGLGVAEPEVAVFLGAEVDEHPVLLEPFLGEHPHRAVAERDHRLASAGGGEQVGKADLGAAVVDVAVELEPVDPGGDRELELAGRADQLPFGLDPPAGQDEFAGDLPQSLGGKLHRAGVDPRVLRLAEPHLEEQDVGRALGRRCRDGSTRPCSVETASGVVRPAGITAPS